MTRTRAKRGDPSHLIEDDAPNAGEWVQPISRGYLLTCCDCGLVHSFDFRVVKNGSRGATIQSPSYHAQFRAYRAAKLDEDC